MKKAVLLLIFLIVGILFFALALWQVDMEKTLQIFQDFPIFGYVILFLVFMINILILSIRWKVIIGANFKETKLKNIVNFKIAGFALSYATPTVLIGGEPLRILFLKEVEKVPLSTGTSSVLIDKILEITAFFIMVCCGVFFALKNQINFGWSLAMEIFLFFVFFLLLAFFVATIRGKKFFTFIFDFLPEKKIFKKVESYLKKVEQEMIYFFGKKTKRFLLSIALSLLGVSLIMLENFLALYFLGINLNFVQVLIFTAIPGLTFLMPIPGAFGAYELSRNSIFSVFALSPELAMTSSIIIRMRDLCFVLLGILLASRYGMRFFMPNRAKKAAAKK